MSRSQTNNIVRMDWLQIVHPPVNGQRQKRESWLSIWLLAGGDHKSRWNGHSAANGWMNPVGSFLTPRCSNGWLSRGKENLFTRQFVLSVKDAALTPEAFNRAMGAGGDLFHEWRLIQHEDSRYPHAHALAFGQEEVRIKSEVFRQWWLEVRAALEQERQAQVELAQVQQQALKLEQRTEQTLSPQLNQQQTAVPDHHQVQHQMAEVAEEVGNVLEKSWQQGWGLG